jgi:Ca-activated chloride channel family protein
MREIARVSGGKSFRASDEEGLEAVYERLGSQVGTRREKRQITAGFAAGGLVLLLGAAGASVRRFGRLP